LSKFIEYYEDNKSKFALKMPESSDAVQIMTIHKSKGLEFPVVIIPKIDFSLSIHNEAKFFVEADGKVLYTSLSKNNVLDEIHDKAIEEENLILLDKLNLLYVGLTRPEQRLYVFNRFDRSSNLGHLFHQNMATTFSISDDDGLLFYEAGTKNKKLNAVVGDGDFYIPKEVVNETSKFQIAFRKVQKERYTSQDERLFGVYFHALMGEIENSSEIDTTLSQLVDRGVVDMSMRTKIEATAKVFFQQGEAIGLLEGIQKVLNERPILLPSGKLFIPDKVMVRSNDIVVLDFKTGKKESKHEKQVRNYKKHLEEIFNQKVIPMLYYTQSNEFIQV
jgi:ATP-dependent exoDNAse (exonuclease V) beta subunit